jgi:hypothetical protein
LDWFFSGSGDFLPGLLNDVPTLQFITRSSFFPFILHPPNYVPAHMSKILVKNLQPPKNLNGFRQMLPDLSRRSISEGGVVPNYSAPKLRTKVVSAKHEEPVIEPFASDIFELF